MVAPSQAGEPAGVCNGRADRGEHQRLSLTVTPLGSTGVRVEIRQCMSCGQRELRVETNDHVISSEWTVF